MTPDSSNKVADTEAWWRISPEDAPRRLETDPERGLSDEEARQRLSGYGPNELIERSVKSVWKIVWRQLRATLVVILVAAAAVSAVLGDYEDAIAIVAIVVLNAILGVRQEYKAEHAMAALKKLAVPTVKVRRGGGVKEVSSRELVPGDVVLLEAGDSLAADGRLLESANLRVQEAALTGESEPVEKEAKLVFDTEQPLADRRNMFYRGTAVTYGRGLGLVTETGMRTELGRIADLLQTFEEEPTPLQRRLDQLGRILVVLALAIVLLIFLVGLLRGEDLRLMFLTAVSLAVAAVPEGLPAVVTISLALGAERMLKRRALIRRLPAVETLGSVTVICSDKTGTLTQNRMTVAVLDVAGCRIELEQNSEALGKTESGDQVAVESDDTATLLLLAGTLCNDASLGTESGEREAVGDPTETALVVAAARHGLRKPELEKALPRVAEAPFDSERKRMTTLHRLPPAETAPAAMAVLLRSAAQGAAPGCIAFAKGAFDSLLKISTHVWADGRTQALDDTWRRRITEAHDGLAGDGMRVLGAAFRLFDQVPKNPSPESLEQQLVFLGLVAMIDPPRQEVSAAVETCRSAGIRPVMITGDHPLTARYIAQQLRLIDAGDEHMLTGAELNRLSEQELGRKVAQVGVYARVSPEDKLHIVDALRNRGEIVAMTGDGVNDAPALKSSDIGIAMGITGTDVAKEASDMVLQDDNFATIVAAIEEGRIIFDNIRKFIKYLLAANSGELWVMLLGPLAGMPLPLLPLQILWMNLVTDGPPALALGLEPAERDTMRRAPYPPAESVFARGVGRDIVWIGLFMGLAALAVGYAYWREGLEIWQTMAFSTLTFSQLALALAVRSTRDSLFTVGLASNKFLLGAVALSFVLQLGVIYLRPLQAVFETEALTAAELGICLAVSSLAFWAVELQKFFLRLRKSV